MNRKGSPTTLHTLAADEGKVVLAWRAKPNGEACLVSGKGGVFSVSAQSARLVARFPATGKLTRGDVAAVGDTVFGRNGDSIVRVNLSTGAMESRKVSARRPRLQNLRVLTAASDNVLLLAEMGDLSETVSPENAKAETSRLFVLSFLTGRLTEVARVPAPVFSYAVDGKMLWLSWTDSSSESSVVATFSISDLT